MSYPCKLSAKAIIATLPEKIKEQDEKQKFEEYIAECTRMTAKNSANLISGGEYVDIKYRDFINPKPEDNRSGDEIAADIINRMGLEVV